MKAIILAAGRGSRLMPYTEDCPKCLTELDGRPLIHRQIEVLRDEGVSDIIILTGYRAEMLDLPGVRTIHNPAWGSTNMVESLFCAEAEFGDDLLVCYSDILYSRHVLRAVLASPQDISIAVDHDWKSYWEQRFDDPLSDAESLKLSADGAIIDIGNKVSNIDEIEAQYIGLCRFRSAGITALRAARCAWSTETRPWMARRSAHMAYMTDLLTEMILRGSILSAVPINGGWVEIDTPHDLTVALELIKQGRLT